MPDTPALRNQTENRTALDRFWSVRDSDVPVRFADMITECRHHNSVVYLSLGAAIMDLNGAPTVDVAARLRLDLGTARNLHAMLATMIAEMVQEQA